MTTIAQGPRRRFTSVIVRTDDATPGSSSTIIPVEQDIVVHSVAMNMGFTCPVGTFALVAVGPSMAGSGWGDGIIGSSFLSMTWSNLHATVQRPTGSFNESVELGGMILPSGGRIVVDRTTSTSGGQSSSVVGTVVISFSTVSEWNNFIREHGKPSWR